MLTIWDKQPGRTLSEDARVFGAFDGDVTVPSQVRLELFGTVAGNLLVEDGGDAVVFGTVVGTVVNRGRLEVYGVITGALRDDSGKAQVDPKAIVRGGVS